MGNLNTDLWIKNKLEQITSDEKTDISYYRVVQNSDTLVVSFASLNHNQLTGFERKSSLLNFSKDCPIDILYIETEKIGI